MLNGIWCFKVVKVVIDKSNLKSKKKNEILFKIVKLILYVFILWLVIILLIN